MTITQPPRRLAPWRNTRRLTDYVFRVRIPGRHHNLTSWWGR